VAERPVIADTGPLVAFLVKREPRRDWAVEQFKSLPAPFIDRAYAINSFTTSPYTSVSR
jgi:hypothetical protein